MKTKWFLLILPLILSVDLLFVVTVTGNAEKEEWVALKIQGGVEMRGDFYFDVSRNEIFKNKKEMTCVAKISIKREDNEFAAQDTTAEYTDPIKERAPQVKISSEVLRKQIKNIGSEELFAAIKKSGAIEIKPK